MLRTLSGEGAGLQKIEFCLIKRSREMENLLLVVDDWESLDFYEEKLRPYFQVETAFIAEEAIRTLQERKAITWVLVDLSLEDCTPQEFLEKLIQKDLFVDRFFVFILDSESKLDAAQTKQFASQLNVFRRPYEFKEVIELLNKKNSPRL